MSHEKKMESTFLDIEESAAADVREKVKTALALLHDGMPNLAQDWLYSAADTLHAANEERREKEKRILKAARGES